MVGGFVKKDVIFVEKIDTEKKRSFIINFVYLLIILGLVFIVLKYLMPLLSPFVIALVIACLLRKPVMFQQKRLPFPKKITAAYTVALFFIAVGALVSVVGVEAVTGVRNLILNLPEIYAQRLEPAIIETFTRIELAALHSDIDLYRILEEFESKAVQTAGDMVTKLSGEAMAAIGSIAYSIPGLFIKLVLLIISTFFISMDYERLSGFCLSQMNEKGRNLLFQVKEYVVGTLFVVIRSYLLIMSITCVELSIGLTVIGIKNSVLIAACISIFDILPVLGTGGIMLPWALITAIRGDMKLAVSLLLVYVIITVIRNILEPKIVGGQLGLHPVVTLSSMFAGVQLFGVVGLFGFPIFLSLLCYLDNAGTIHLFRKPASAASEVSADNPENP